QDGWTFGVAGGIGGLSVALLDSSRRQTLTFFTLSRSMKAVLSTLVTRGYLQDIPFFDVGVFCACESIIVYCTAMAPQYLDPGYYRALLRWTRDLTDEKLTLAFRKPGPRYLNCAETGLHEGSCFQHRVKDLFLSLYGFAKLYLPIHLMPILLYKRALFCKRPTFVLYYTSTFISVQTDICTLLHFNIYFCTDRHLYSAPIGAVGGLAILFERFSRRKELALFVIPHFLNILYVAAEKSPALKPFLRLPHGFTLVFALSMTSVMHAYEREPQSLTMLINGVLRFFFGPSSNSTQNSKKSKTDTVKSENENNQEVPIPVRDGSGDIYADSPIIPDQDSTRDTEESSVERNQN
ncbi:hypothetical protein EGW08_013822, partial [Elysia chlorotica]